MVPGNPREKGETLLLKPLSITAVKEARVGNLVDAGRQNEKTARRRGE